MPAGYGQGVLWPLVAPAHVAVGWPLVAPGDGARRRRRLGPNLPPNNPSLTSSSRVWGHGFRMASLLALRWTRISYECASYVPASRFVKLQAGRPKVREHEND